MKAKILRVTTVPISLKILLKDQLKFINNFYEVVGISSNGQELYDVSVSEGIRVVGLDMSREISLIKDFQSLVKMVVLIRRENPDIIHTHTPKAGIVGMLAGWLCKTPHRLHTVAGLPVEESVGFKRKVLLFTEWLTCACATRVYPNSFALSHYMVKNIRVSQDKLKVIGFGSSNGVDVNYFNLTTEVKKSANSLKQIYDLGGNFIFLYVGRVVRDKGINELLSSFSRLKLEFSNIRLVIVGNEEPSLNPISEESKVIIKNNPSIIMTGFQDDVRPFYAMSDCLTFPSYREGFPNVVLQACSMGKACIVSDINGCNEIISSRTNGLIIKPKSENDLYNAMKELILDRRLLARLSKSARLSILKKYCRIDHNTKMLDEYRHILND